MNAYSMTTAPTYTGFSPSMPDPFLIIQENDHKVHNFNPITFPPFIYVDITVHETDLWRCYNTYTLPRRDIIRYYGRKQERPLCVQGPGYSSVLNSGSGFSAALPWLYHILDINEGLKVNSTLLHNEELHAHSHCTPLAVVCHWTCRSKKLVGVMDIYHLWVFTKEFEMPFGIHLTRDEQYRWVKRGCPNDISRLEENGKSLMVQET